MMSLAFLKTRAAGFLGLALIITALIGAILWFRSEAADARADLVGMTADRDALKLINDTNAKTIERLEAMQMENARIAADVANRTQSSTSRADSSRREISRERQSNATVDDYLRQRVPDGVGRVLNNGQAGSSN